MGTIRTPLEMKLWATLKRISSYDSPDRLRRNSERDYAYENVIAEAKQAIKRLRVPKSQPPKQKE